MSELRAMLRDNIALIIATYDAHDPGVLRDGTHLCPCGLIGTQGEWEQHLGRMMADAVDPAVQEQLYV